MDLRKAHHRNAHTLRLSCRCGLFRSDAGNRGVGRILFGREAIRRVGDPGSGGDNQRAVGASECCAKRLNGAPIGLADLHEFREVVDERGVDHSFRRGGPAAQASEIFQ